jgi:hypothetical protein
VSALACPDCPVCGHPPAFVLDGGQQAFCGNDACVALMWNPSKSRADNVRDAGTIDLGDDGGKP